MWVNSLDSFNDYFQVHLGKTGTQSLHGVNVRWWLGQAALCCLRTTPQTPLLGCAVAWLSCSSLSAALDIFWMVLDISVFLSNHMCCMLAYISLGKPRELSQWWSVQEKVSAKRLPYMFSPQQTGELRVHIDHTSSVKAVQYGGSCRGHWLAF